MPKLKILGLIFDTSYKLIFCLLLHFCQNEKKSIIIHKLSMLKLKILGLIFDTSYKLIYLESTTQSY